MALSRNDWAEAKTDLLKKIRSSRNKTGDTRIAAFGGKRGGGEGSLGRGNRHGTASPDEDLPRMSDNIQELRENANRILPHR